MYYPGKVIEKYLCPLMAAHGFTYRFYPQDGTWDFIKSAEKEQCVFVDQAWKNTLRLELRITPTFRHKHITISEKYMDQCTAPKWMLGGYLYHNQGELETIVQFYAKAMEEQGFALLEDAISDTLDIVPTQMMEKDLFQNHSKYAEEFSAEYEMRDWEPKNIADIVVQELLQFDITQITAQDMDKLVHLAAVYGTIFERIGGQWDLDDGSRCSITVQQAISPFPYIIQPLTFVYHFLHYGTQENKEALLFQLRNLGLIR